MREKLEQYSQVEKHKLGDEVLLLVQEAILLEFRTFKVGHYISMENFKLFDQLSGRALVYYGSFLYILYNTFIICIPTYRITDPSS